ncbi:hypothetical protein [Rhodococcus sp. DN22]|uniref:hypothetical protein n=1 Tax=Rhodococcus sp. DN22 TaxID=357684 RepID=UPI0030D14F47
MGFTLRPVFSAIGSVTSAIATGVGSLFAPEPRDPSAAPNDALRILENRFFEGLLDTSELLSAAGDYSDESRSKREEEEGGFVLTFGTPYELKEAQRCVDEARKHIATLWDVHQRLVRITEPPIAKAATTAVSDLDAWARVVNPTSTSRPSSISEYARAVRRGN